ncbi:MAG: UbiX family flavin prenyltransferase [Gaiellaceae bacterium]
MKVFVGITGASGMPYAARLLELLAGGGCEVGLCVSDAGVQVLATELYDEPRLARDETLARLTAPVGETVRIFDPSDYSSPYASGSARVDAYVICPCSMSSAGQIAAGAGSNLIHRAAAVALKEERKLVLVPRETPLSLVHLEALSTLRRAGATIVFAAPSFYGRPRTLEDLVDTVIARVLDQLGLEHELGPRWGEGWK